ncbi:hypothetical protein [Streptomyces sp. NPDC002676]
MRIRATVAAVSGALALSALAAPAALATDAPQHSRADLVKAAHAAHQASSGKAGFSGVAADTGVPYALNLTFSNVKVNNGKPIVAGISNKVSVPTSFTVTHDAGIDLHAPDIMMDVDIHRGSLDDPNTRFLFGDDWPTCTDTSATTATCKGTIDVYPDVELVNADAATWKAEGYIFDWNDQDPMSDNIDWSKVGYAGQDALADVKLQRYSKLTANAAPEPVAKGKTITVTGALTRANWETHKYAGYTNQPVQLQFFKKGGTSYTTLKTITSSSTTGSLKTTTTATVDGYYRFYFAGTPTTPAVKSTADFVDVQ